MTAGPGLWITGQSRSGTSMTAGLFAAHGVWFGRCKPADWYNPKGYFEHLEIVRRTGAKDMEGWPEAWWRTMEWEGYQDGPWAIKRGPASWPWIKPLAPAVVVVTHRPADQILGSRLRTFPDNTHQRRTMQRVQARVDRVAAEAPCPVVRVDTSLLVAGEYQALLPAFDALRVTFDPAVAAEWIDPGIWNRGAKP